MARLEKKIAIVTGAGAGIGRATAQLFAEEGATVVATDIDGDAARETVANLAGEGVAMAHDVTSEDDWQKVTDAAMDRFGGLDVLVNNAGIQLTRALEETSLADWRRVLATNTEGPFLGTRYAIRRMKQTGGGSIVNVCSTYAMMADGLNAAYCSSKAATRHFTKVAALYCAERGYGIRVNAVHPGVIMTPMLQREIVEVSSTRGLSGTQEVEAEWQKLAPMGIGAPHNIAAGILYLASDEAAYVTGTDLVIDGGHLVG